RRIAPRGGMTMCAHLSWRALAGALLISAAAGMAAAQGSTDDSVTTRVLHLAANGNPAGARALADSILSAAKPGSGAYVDALYARASIMSSPDSARHDLLRIVVDFSMSPRE